MREIITLSFPYRVHKYFIRQGAEISWKKLYNAREIIKKKKKEKTDFAERVVTVVNKKERERGRKK